MLRVKEPGQHGPPHVPHVVHLQLYEVRVGGLDEKFLYDPEEVRGRDGVAVEPPVYFREGPGETLLGRVFPERDRRHHPHPPQFYQVRTQGASQVVAKPGPEQLPREATPPFGVCRYRVVPPRLREGTRQDEKGTRHKVEKTRRPTAQGRRGGKQGVIWPF